jgi:predicted metal-dependent peptidase
MKYKSSDQIDYFRITFDAIGESSTLFINEQALESLTLKQRLFYLEHEVLHWVYEHPLNPNIDDRLYHIATDMTINDMLQKQGAVLGENSLTGERFYEAIVNFVPPEHNIREKMPKIMSTSDSYYEWVKWVYELLPKQTKPGEGEGENDSGAGAGIQGAGNSDKSGDSSDDSDSSSESGEDEDSSSSESDGKESSSQTLDSGNKSATEVIAEMAEDTNHDWRELSEEQGMQESIQQTLSRELQEDKDRTEPHLFQKFCGHIAGQIEQLIKAKRKPQVAWNFMLRRFVGYCGGVQLRSTSGQLNKYGTPPKIKLLPGTKIAVLLDTSGSISTVELNHFLAELNAIHRNGVEIDVIQFDFQVQAHAPFRKAETYIIKGRGGTSFVNAFAYLERLYRSCRYTGTVVLTDGEAEFPQRVPGRTLWVCTTNTSVPQHCGEVIRLKVVK